MVRREPPHPHFARIVPKRGRGIINSANGDILKTGMGRAALHVLKLTFNQNQGAPGFRWRTADTDYRPNDSAPFGMLPSGGLATPAATCGTPCAVGSSVGARAFRNLSARRSLNARLQN